MLLLEKFFVLVLPRERRPFVTNGLETLWCDAYVKVSPMPDLPSRMPAKPHYPEEERFDDDESRLMYVIL